MDDFQGPTVNFPEAIDGKIPISCPAKMIRDSLVSTKVSQFIGGQIETRYPLVMSK